MLRFISGNQTPPLSMEIPRDGAVIVQQFFQPGFNPAVVLDGVTG